MSKIKHKNYRSLFEYEERMQELTKKAWHIERLNEIIPWERFREKLERALKKQAKGPGGAPHFDYLLMFKILVLQRFYSLSDEQTEYQIKDRLSFQKFLGLSLSDEIPDEKTIWHFRESLIKAKVFAELFESFNKYLKEKGYVGKEGVIVDATIVETPRQRNSREENEKIQRGEMPESFKENSHKACQKDMDARWLKKEGRNYFGYKNHIKIDKESKLILNTHVTSANVHDSQAVEYLLDQQEDMGKEVWADSAYTAEVFHKYKMKARVHKKGCRYKKLTERERAENREKSKIRARVEHVFGFVKSVMKGYYIRARGYARAQSYIILSNLLYNMCRYRLLVSRAS